MYQILKNDQKSGLIINDQIKQILSLPANNHTHSTYDSNSPQENEEKRKVKSNQITLKSCDNAIEFYSKNITESNPSILIKRAVCYMAKGQYSLSLKDALATIKIDETFTKGYYIAALSYLEMMDIENAKKYCDGKNKKLVMMINNQEEEIKNKTMQFNNYPLYLNMIKTLYNYNAFFPKIEVIFNSNDNRTVFSKRQINKNETIMQIPKDCLITLGLAKSTEYGKEISKFMYKDLNSPKHCLLSAFLLYEQFNEKWKFYFDFLPKDFSSFPNFYTDEELDYLKGSSIYKQINDKKREMKSDYDKMCQYIPEFTQFSFEDFCKARTLVCSRIFGTTIDSVKTDILAPYADLLNHSKEKQTQWYYDNNLESFVIQAIENIPAQTEIFDSYGSKSNSRYFIHYGFCVENNESNEYNLSISFNENYPMYNSKLRYFAEPKEFNRNFKLNNLMYESETVELLAFIRFLIYDGNENDLFELTGINDEFFFGEDSRNGYFFISPVNKELEIKALQFFLNNLKECISQYPTTYEEDKKKYESNEELSFNMKNCLLALISEKYVLNYFVYFCEYCLELLEMNIQQVIEKTKEDFKRHDCQFDFYVKGVIINLLRTEDSS